MGLFAADDATQVFDGKVFRRQVDKLMFHTPSLRFAQILYNFCTPANPVSAGICASSDIFSPGVTPQDSAAAWSTLLR